MPGPPTIEDPRQPRHTLIQGAAVVASMAAAAVAVASRTGVERRLGGGRRRMNRGVLARPARR